MQSKLFSLALLLSTVVVLPGCKSSSPRLGWWKPSSMWASKTESAETEASALARSAPPLPSKKFDAIVDAETAVASTTKEAAPGAPADLLATAPTAKYPSQSAPAYEAPLTDTLASSAPSATGPANTPAATSIAPQSGPYSNQGYAAADTSSNNLPSLESGTPSATPLADRYAQLDRYSNQPTPSSASLAPVTPPATTDVLGPGGENLATGPSVPEATAAAQPYSAPDRYAQYDNPSTSGQMAATSQPTMPMVPDTSIPGSTPSATPAPASLASVQLPATPGGYRPGGTSTYAPSSTANIATRPTTPESSTGYPPPRYQDTPAPAAPDNYGAPAYR